jgi:hypothetical protein
MRAEASFHADDAAQQLLERVDQCKAFDLPSECDLAISAETAMWKTSLPISMPIEARGVVLVFMSCFSG